MKLKDLFFGFIETSITDFVKGISYDPLRCKEGFIYIAIDIYTQLNGIEIPDGHKGIELAVINGAKWIITEKEVPDIFNTPIFRVESSRLILAQLSKKFYSEDESFETIGIIGTNGKTSVSYLLYQLLNSKKEAAYLGTIGSFINDKPHPSKDTTPEPPDLWMYRKKLVEENIHYSVMEVSSHGICFERVNGLNFNHLIFTNITPDHLDFHKTFENYLSAKLKPFQEMRQNDSAIINKDALYSDQFLNESVGKVLTYGQDSKSDVYARDIVFSESGVSFDLLYQGEVKSIQAPLLGKHNLENILAVSACALNIGFDLKEVQEFWPSCKQIPGRLEKIEEEKVKVLIDYAHTEDAMKHVLESLKPLCQRSLRVIFGCGGDRDRSKRSPMGRVACDIADKVYLTQDNPRYEDPDQIIEDILEGCDLSKLEVIKNRREAIIKALSESKPHDWVVILGKGHEKTQSIKGEMIPFDEREIVEDYFKKSYRTFSQPENL